MTLMYATSTDRATIADHVERRFNRAGGQARLEAELRRLAFDMLGRHDRDDLDATCREAVLRTTRAAVAASVEPLVARFIAEIARGVAALPPEMQARLMRGEGRGDLGFD